MVLDLLVNSGWRKLSFSFVLRKPWSRSFPA